MGYWTAEELKTSNLVWQAWHDLPCRTKYLLVLIFAIFPAIRKNKFSQINDTGNIFPIKIYSRVNILLLKFATQKRNTKKSCLFIHNLSASFRNETVYYELLVLCRVRTPKYFLKMVFLLNKPQWNTRWAFARKHDIFRCENNMLSSHVNGYISIKVKWCDTCISLVLI